MQVNKVDAIRLSDFTENEKVFIIIGNDGRKINIEPISSLEMESFEEDELNNLGIGEMTRSFGVDVEAPEDFMLIIRVK